MAVAHILSFVYAIVFLVHDTCVRGIGLLFMYVVFVGIWNIDFVVAISLSVVQREESACVTVLPFFAIVFSLISSLVLGLGEWYRLYYFPIVMLPTMLPIAYHYPEQRLQQPIVPPTPTAAVASGTRGSFICDNSKCKCLRRPRHVASIHPIVSLSPPSVVLSVVTQR